MTEFVTTDVTNGVNFPNSRAGRSYTLSGSQVVDVQNASYDVYLDTKISARWGGVREACNVPIGWTRKGRACSWR